MAWLDYDREYETMDETARGPKCDCGGTIDRETLKCVDCFTSYENEVLEDDDEYDFFEDC